MKKIIIATFIVATVILCCHKKYENVIGLWEENKNASWTKAFEIKKEGGKYFIDMYTYYRKPTKYIESNGDTIILKPGSTIDHKKAELFYDSQKKVYTGNFGNLSINISVVDEEHLELRLPFETKIYRSKVSMDIGLLRFAFPDES